MIGYRFLALALMAAFAAWVVWADQPWLRWLGLLAFGIWTVQLAWSRDSGPVSNPPMCKADPASVCPCDEWDTDARCPRRP